MVNLLPAVLIGGPPQAGKSVLFHSLTYALRERGIHHHAIRACPDGEGNWSQESDPETVSQIREKGEWSDEFVKRICQDLEHRCLPFLVDMGGQPKESQACMLRLCTHSVLLFRTDKPDYTQLWHRLVEENALLPLAEVYSQLEGTSTIIAHNPIIEGTITGLVRDKEARAKGPLFEALVESIAMLFKSYSPHELEQVFFEQAPSELLNLYDFVPSTERWKPEMLPSFLANLPTNTSFSVYGIAPNWVYAALAAHVGQHPLYQFDPRLPFGWIQPLSLQLSIEQFSEVQVQTHVYPDVTVLSIKIPSKHLEYFQQEPLPFPPVPPGGGLIIDGIIPYWLLTALVRLYKEAGVAWIASYYPQLKGAVVAYAGVATYTPGDLVAMPAHLHNLFQL